MVNQIKAGAILSYISIIVNNIIGLLYTPFLIRVLGPSEFGLYSLAQSMVNYLLIMDLGFGNAVTRFTATYRAENDSKSEAVLHGMFIVTYFIIGVLVIASGWGLAFYSEKLFSDSMTIDELKKIKVLLSLLTINLSITFFFSTYKAILAAYEKFVFIKTVDLVRIIITPLLMIPLLLMGFKSIALVTVITVLNITVMVSNYVFYRREIPTKPIFGVFNKTLFKTVFGYSSLVFIATIVDQVNWNSGQFILGTVASTAAVAVYSVAITIKNLYFSFSTAIISVFLPKVTEIVSGKQADKQLSNLFIKIGRLQYLIMSFVLSAFILFGREFIYHWVGKSYDDAYTITLLLIVPATIPLIQNIGMTILQAKNLLKFRSISFLIIAVVNISIAIPMAKFYHGFGIACVTCVTLFIANGLIMNVYYKRKINLDISHFWLEIFKVSIPVLASVCIFLLLELFFTNDKGVVNFITRVGTYIILFLILVWSFGVNKYEKNLLKKIIDDVWYTKNKHFQKK